MPEALPSFSIIIATYDRPRQVAECLAGLREASYPRDRFEVIVAVDGGNEELAQAAERAGDGLRLRVERLPRGGQSAARNAAAELAEGDLLAFIDDDCVPAPSWLAGLAEAHGRAPADALGGRTMNALTNNLCSETTHLLNDVLYDRDDREGWYFAANNLAVPSEGYREIGGFRTEIVHQEDRDLCERWTAHGYGMTRATEAVAYHAHGATLPQFVKQHFTYGQGAHQISQSRAERSGRPPRPEIDLHLEFVRRAWRRERHGARLALLVLISQAAFFAGYTAKRLLGLPAPWDQPTG